MIQLNLSDKDAKTLASILSSAARFYPLHAVHTRDQDTGRKIKKMAKKINQEVNRAAAQPRPKNKQQQ